MAVSWNEAAWNNPPIRVCLDVSVRRKAYGRDQKYRAIFDMAILSPCVATMTLAVAEALNPNKPNQTPLWARG